MSTPEQPYILVPDLESTEPITEANIATYKKQYLPTLGLDNLIGPEMPGYEGKYWQPVTGDNTAAGFWLSGAGIRVPKTIHIPTGSTISYRKILLVLADGSKIPAWEKHADL